jgi:hypothetical protein
MRVGLGFSIHTGWAVAVAVAGERPVILARRKLLLADENHDSRFVFHAAAERPTQAEQMIANAGRIAAERASAALRELIAELASHSLVVALPPSKKLLPPLEKILKAHPLIHSAEAELYRSAVAEAAEAVGLRVRTLDKGPTPDVGKMSPPWGKDQKDAAALAWAALQNARP